MKNKNKNKKLLSFVMAAMMLGATSPAFAAGNSAKTTIKARCSIPDVKIQVVVPAGANVHINPKKLPVKIAGGINYDDNGNVTEVNDQIITDPTYIQNQSEVPVKVTVGVSGAVKSGSTMKLSSSSVADLETTDKRAFVYFEIVPTSDPDAPVWEDEYDDEKHIVVSSTTKTKTDLITLGTTEQGNCYGAFRLTGDCTAEPKVPWSTKDGLNATITFSFKALPIDAELE